jgi:hypothetical protein
VSRPRPPERVSSAMSSRSSRFYASTSFSYRVTDPDPPRSRKGGMWLGGILIVLLLVAQTGFGHSVLQAAGLTRPSDSFVELYFPDARALPSALPASGRLTVRFALGYVGSRSHSLYWRVYGPTGKSLTSGDSVVTANRTDLIVRSVRISCSGKRTRLSVSVEHSSARITLWLTCRGRR